MHHTLAFGLTRTKWHNNRQTVYIMIGAICQHGKSNDGTIISNVLKTTPANTLPSNFAGTHATR
jgi:hypothetical protein